MKIIVKLLAIILCFTVSLGFTQAKLKTYNALMLLPKNFDDIEFSTIAEIFNSANIKITTVGIGGVKVQSISGLQITTNKQIQNVNTHDYDFVILMGSNISKYYNAYPLVENLLKSFNQDKKIIAATTLAPLFLDRIGLTFEKSITVDPVVASLLDKNTIYVANQSIKDGNLITSYSPGSIKSFVMLIITALHGPEVTDRIQAELLL